MVWKPFQFFRSSGSGLVREHARNPDEIMLGSPHEFIVFVLVIPFLLFSEIGFRVFGRLVTQRGVHVGVRLRFGDKSKAAPSSLASAVDPP